MIDPTTETMKLRDERDEKRRESLHEVAGPADPGERGGAPASASPPGEEPDSYGHEHATD